MAVLLPETCRRIVGNGSLRPPPTHQLPAIPGIAVMKHWTNSDPVVTAPWRIPNPLKSLAVLARRDNAVVILACGLLYAVYTCINASLSILLVDLYALNQWQAGLVYLPFGIGGTVSTFFSGVWLDRAYRAARRRDGLEADRARGDDLDAFDVEKARVRVVWAPMGGTVVSVVAFGWVVHFCQVCWAFAFLCACMCMWLTAVCY